MKPPEDVKAEIVRQWLAKAEQDLDAAETLLCAENPLFYPACFHAQQAGEKFLKAFLTWRQIEFPQTHSIRELLNLVGTVDEELATNLQPAAALTPYGVEVRYPSDAPEPDLREAREAVGLAQKVRDAVLKMLERIT